MKANTVVACILLITLTSASLVHADYESKLLDRFRKQNQTAAEQIKQRTETNLLRAESLRSTAPDEAVHLLRQCLHELEDDIGLSSDERSYLLRSVTSRLHEVEVLAAAKRRRDLQSLEQSLADSAVAEPAPAGRLQVGQAAGAFQVTPVVSGDRRFVRIGVNGIFTSMSPGPFFAGPRFTTIGLNTTVNAPVGGSVVVGGYTSSASYSSSYGTPILGHIPYVNRLFNNVGYGGFSNSTQVIVAPRVFILGQ